MHIIMKKTSGQFVIYIISSRLFLSLASLLLFLFCSIHCVGFPFRCTNIKWFRFEWDIHSRRADQSRSVSIFFPSCPRQLATMTGPRQKYHHFTEWNGIKSTAQQMQAGDFLGNGTKSMQQSYHFR